VWVAVVPKLALSILSDPELCEVTAPATSVPCVTPKYMSSKPSIGSFAAIALILRASLAEDADGSVKLNAFLWNRVPVTSKDPRVESVVPSHV